MIIYHECIIESVFSRFLNTTQTIASFTLPVRSTSVQLQYLIEQEEKASQKPEAPAGLADKLAAGMKKFGSGIRYVLKKLLGCVLQAASSYGFGNYQIAVDEEEDYEDDNDGEDDDSEVGGTPVMALLSEGHEGKTDEETNPSIADMDGAHMVTDDLSPGADDVVPFEDS